MHHFFFFFFFFSFSSIIYRDCIYETSLHEDTVRDEEKQKGVASWFEGRCREETGGEVEMRTCPTVIFHLCSGFIYIKCSTDKYHVTAISPIVPRPSSGHSLGVRIYYIYYRSTGE